MIDRVKEMIHVLPVALATVVKHSVLTGLRPIEACESVRLLLNFSNDVNIHHKTKEEIQYYNPQTQMLEHFRFPEIFIRRTKKAFISYITKNQLSGIATLGSSTPTYTAIRKACEHRHIRMDMHLCRKIHASWLHQSGITSEAVDFLQGRVSPSVFSRHYLTPDSSLRSRVLDALDRLKEAIENE